MIKMASATPMALRLVRLLALAGGAGAITVNGVPLGGVAPAPPQAGLTLQLEGVGNLTVLSGEEPALAVERFAAKASEAGHAVNAATMDSMLGWFCARRACRRAVAGPVSLNVTGVGSLTVAPFEDPAHAVERFAAKATAAGVAFNVETMVAMLDRLCAQRSCFRTAIAGPLSLAVEGLGNLTVLPFEDPADRVEYFGGRATDAGAPINVQTLDAMYAWFCDRRSCFRPLARPWTLEVKPLGNVTVLATQEPAYMVEKFAAAATAAGADVSGEAMRSMMAWFCDRRSCHRPVAPPLTLALTGVGNVTVRPWQEPAERVERFAIAAAAAGAAMNVETMADMLAYFCARRACFRPLRPPLTLGLEGVGNVTVAPFEDVAPRVEGFAAAAARAGRALAVDDLNAMMDWFCARRVCARGLAPPLELTVDGLGTLKVEPWMDPTDSVEHFAAQVAAAGVAVDGETMVEMLTWICERRACGRTQLRPPPPPKQLAGDARALPAPAAAPGDVVAA